MRLVVPADITNRIQAEGAVQQAVQGFGRLDILVNNAGLMLLGPVVGADAESGTAYSPLTSRACSTPPVPLYHTCSRPPRRARAEAPTSSTSARSQVASPGTAMGLQPHQVRRERIHRVLTSGSHPAARAGRRHRAGWRGPPSSAHITSPRFATR
jgi:hypothetical protein